MLTLARDHGVPIFPLIIAHSAYRTSPLRTYQAFNDPEAPLESLPRHEQNKILNALAIAVGEKALDKNRRVEPQQPRLKDIISALREIRRHLSLTSQAFVAQARRRDELVTTIERRLGFRSKLEYEKFFFRYYPELTREEHFEFDQIRAITEGALKASNQSILGLMEEHPTLLTHVPSLVALHQHLVFWLNKFDRVFTRHPEMCLLYAGVEDAVPFPNGIEVDIDQWLATAKHGA